MGPPAALTRPRCALTIAGTDSGGGAGVAADLKTFHALGVHGALAVTAVTAQDTVGVGAVHPVPATVVAEQIERVAGDLGVDAAKTGMLGGEEVVRAVAAAVRSLGIGPLVVDPVLAAGTGRPLLDRTALTALVGELLPLAALVTPNLAEAAALLGVEAGSITSVAGMRAAARDLLGLGPRAVLVTGGHLEGDPVDVFYDGSELVELRGPRIPDAPTHGSGCTVSAAATAYLALGASTADAVRLAGSFVREAIRTGLVLGRGEGPVNPGGAVRRPSG
jgi:hydroxymethylpyrimidine/phosphomethylpyrimidine kinase